MHDVFMGKPCNPFHDAKGEQGNENVYPNHKYILKEIKNSN